MLKRSLGMAHRLGFERVRLATSNPVYRRVFDFWLSVFALSFGTVVVTGIIMAFQVGAN